MSYSVVVPARNEQKFIHDVLFSLKHQSIQPKFICVLNDGSTDNTAKILENFKRNLVQIKMKVITIPYHKSLVGTLSLAKIFNLGFKACEKYQTDYVMILGGDTFLTRNYCKTLIKSFESNEKLLIASGKLKGIKITKDHLSGSGRMYRSYFLKLFGYGYPIISAWETSPLHYCQMYGGEYKQIDKALAYHPRKPAGRMKSTVYFGMGMRSMGYWFPFVIGRALYYFVYQKRNIKQAIQVIAGFFSTQTVHGEQQLKDFVRKKQIEKIRRLLWI